MVYFGRRFYSPEFGRWLTPDPAGFTDGMNLYAFVHNDPLTHFDEYGLLDYGQYEPRRENPYFQKVSQFGRQLASQFTHEMYNTFYQPFASEISRFSRFSGMDKHARFGDWDESRIESERNSIDKFFGTNLAESYGSSSVFACMELPAPGTMGSLAGKTARSVSSAGNLAKKAPKLKSFTKGNARDNLITLTGRTPSSSTHAHHVFPKSLVKDFSEYGINVHEPKYLTWWVSKTHLPNAKSYNKTWSEFLDTKPTTEQILEKGKSMMAEHGINVNY